MIEPQFLNFKRLPVTAADIKPTVLYAIPNIDPIANPNVKIKRLSDFRPVAT